MNNSIAGYLSGLREYVRGDWELWTKGRKGRKGNCVAIPGWVNAEGRGNGEFKFVGRKGLVWSLEEKAL
jgi:hypothetical protein